MSIDEVGRTIPLGPQQLFSHSAVLRPEIEAFRNSFERNERFKEFDGLIRSNHRIYEALETNVAGNATSRTLTALTEQMNSLAARMMESKGPHFSKEELSGLDLSNMIEVAKVAEAKQKELDRRRNPRAGGEPVKILQVVEEEEKQ